MQTILIPVDFSKDSMNSCRYAMHFCSIQPAVFHLYHIYNDQIMIPDSSFPSGMDTDSFFNSEVLLALKKQAEESMKEFVDQLNNQIKKQNLVIKVEYTLEGGDPQWEINEATEELHPDLLVIGTHEQGNKRFLESRTAEKIMQKAPAPVIAVPESYENFRLKNIMYVTNFHKLDIHILEQVIKLIGNRSFKIHVCHFAPEKEDKEINVLMEELEKAFENEEQKNIIQFSLVKSNNKQEALATFANYNDIDLIAFLSEKRHLLRDLFISHDFHTKDFFNLEIPVLSMHENLEF